MRQQPDCLGLDAFGAVLVEGEEEQRHTKATGANCYAAGVSAVPCGPAQTVMHGRVHCICRHMHCRHMPCRHMQCRCTRCYGRQKFLPSSVGLHRQCLVGRIASADTCIADTCLADICNADVRVATENRRICHPLWACTHSNGHMRCYLDSVHMAKAPTLQASPGLPQMSDACPSHSGQDSDSVCDASCSSCQTYTFNQACPCHDSLSKQQQGESEQDQSHSQQTCL